MYGMFFIEVDGKPVEEPSCWVYFDWLRSANRVIAADVLHDVKVSTVFIGTNLAQDGPPMVYETMIFGDHQLDRAQLRYSSREDAMRGHALALAEVERLRYIDVTVYYTTASSSARMQAWERLPGLRLRDKLQRPSIAHAEYWSPPPPHGIGSRVYTRPKNVARALRLLDQPAARRRRAPRSPR